MKLTALTADPPEGFIEEWDNSIWNVGFVFRWSSVYEAWLADGMISVRPNDTLAQAWDRDRPNELFTTNDFNIFFSEPLT